MSRTVRYTLASLIAATMAMGLLACSSKQPPPPPVVINMTSNNSAPAAQEPKAKEETAAEKNAPGPEAQNRQYPDAASAQRMTGPPQVAVEQRIDEASFFNTQIHDLATQLLQNFRTDTGPDGAVAVATFVDLNNLYKTSPFGRYIAEQMMGELQRAGFGVVEVRKTDALLIKENYGEYSLSRNIEEIARQSAAQYVLVGTYVTRGHFILVNARLVSNKGSLVASSAMKILQRDPFLDRMLWPSSAPSLAPPVEMPVKGLGQTSSVRIISGS